MYHLYVVTRMYTVSKHNDKLVVDSKLKTQNNFTVLSAEPMWLDFPKAAKRD